MKNTSEKTKSITINLPEDLYKKIEFLTKKRESVKTFIIKLVNKHIEDQEDLKIGLKALKEHKLNPTDTISLEELVKKYGLRD